MTSGYDDLNNIMATMRKVQSLQAEVIRPDLEQFLDALVEKYPLEAFRARRDAVSYKKLAIASSGINCAAHAMNYWYTLTLKCTDMNSKAMYVLFFMRDNLTDYSGIGQLFDSIENIATTDLLAFLEPGHALKIRMRFILEMSVVSSIISLFWQQYHQGDLIKKTEQADDFFISDAIKSAKRVLPKVIRHEDVLRVLESAVDFGLVLRLRQAFCSPNWIEKDSALVAKEFAERVAKNLGECDQERIKSLSKASFNAVSQQIDEMFKSDPNWDDVDVGRAADQIDTVQLLYEIFCVDPEPDCVDKGKDLAKSDSGDLPE